MYGDAMVSLMRRSTSRWWWAVVAGLLCIGMLLPLRASGGDAVPDTLAPVVRTVLPSIVTITSRGEAEPDLPDADHPIIEVFRDVFGDALTRAGRQSAATGVIVDPSGLVVTSAHALYAAETLEAVTADGVRRGVTIVGSDRKTGVAVVRLAGPGPFPQAAFGDSDAVRVGDWVLAIGSPYGLGATVTAGIIGAVPRARPAAAVDELFQTDAATFPSSAGGALVNGRGEVIGLTTMLTSDPFGITFALPGNSVRRVAAQLAREGAVVRGAMDARFQSLTPGLGRALRVPEPIGVLIIDVSPRGAAASAGLRSGDVVTQLHGRRLETSYDVDRLLRDSVPGQVMELAYWRRGQARVSRVTLARETDEPLARPFSGRTAALLRFEARALTPEMGVVVVHVRPAGSPAEARLRAGDIIREINQQPVRTMGDFHRLVDGVKPGDWLALLVQRGRAALYVAIEARRGEVSAQPSPR